MTLRGNDREGLEMGKRVTLKDIAQAANVTTATVSYVINDTPGQKIAPETRKRVLRVARDLHYIPSSAARALRRKRSGCVGVVAKKNLAVPRFSQTIQGIQSELERNGLMVLLCTNKMKDNGLSDYLLAYYEGRVDGVIFLGKDNVGPDDASVERIGSDGVPFVTFDCQQSSDAFSSVDFDYRGGARLLAERVIERCPRRVLYVKPQMATAQEEQRGAGLHDVLDAHPHIELIEVEVPITLGNLDTWDLRYSVGITDEGEELTSAFMETILHASEPLEAGDAVIASWSGWTEPIRQLYRYRGIITAELANNGESHFHPDFYTRMPNFDAGVACADELLSRLDGKPVSARLLRLTNIVSPPAPHGGYPQPAEAGIA